MHCRCFQKKCPLPKNFKQESIQLLGVAQRTKKLKQERNFLAKGYLGRQMRTGRKKLYAPCFIARKLRHKEMYTTEQM